MCRIRTAESAHNCNYNKNKICLTPFAHLRRTYVISRCVVMASPVNNQSFHCSAACCFTGLVLHYAFKTMQLTKIFCVINCPVKGFQCSVSDMLWHCRCACMHVVVALFFLGQVKFIDQDCELLE